jgi:predicted flap endonuclease-1-like 5' DNA nuclease
LDAAQSEREGLMEKLASFGAGAAAGAVIVRTSETDVSPYQERIAELESEIAALQARLETPRVQVPPSFHIETESEILPPFETELSATSALALDIAGSDLDLESLAGAAAVGAVVAEKRGKRTRQVARDPEDETLYETACPQHLSDVHGIGAVFEQRLYGAGIGTYWQLYKTPFEQLREILNVRGVQRESIDLQAIRSDALRLAKETASKGRTWSGGAPDDFEPLKGIGYAFEKRLYDAGICTYAALAQTTPQALEDICGKDLARKPDFKAWIKQAKRLVEKRQAAKPARKKK